MEVSKHKEAGKGKWFTRSKREELKEELIGYGFVLALCLSDGWAIYFYFHLGSIVFISLFFGASSKIQPG